jgi:hypothetical protein
LKPGLANADREERIYPRMWEITKNSIGEELFAFIERKTCHEIRAVDIMDNDAFDSIFWAVRDRIKFV